MLLTSEATQVWQSLNGIFCVYKPTEMSLSRLRLTVLGNLCRDLNKLDVRPPKPYVLIEGDTSKHLQVRVRESYADNVLVAGPRYISDDFKLNWSQKIGKRTSGLAVLGLNKGTKWIDHLHNVKPLRSYKIKGVLGKITDTMYIDGKVLEKVKYSHVTHGIVNKVLQAFQAAHQRTMFTQCGVDIQSQAAYELAIQGPIRPADNKIPVIYSLKCTHFESPNFTIEAQCVNENEDYLISIVHDVGLKCRTVATCTSLQCIQHGLFDLNDALLRKYWNVQHIAQNISDCQKIIQQNESLFKETPANIVEPTIDKSFKENDEFRV